MIIDNNKKNIYTVEEHQNLHKLCNNFLKFTDVTEHITDDVTTKTRYFKNDKVISSKGPFLKFTMGDSDYHKRTEIYSKLSPEKLLEKIKENWYSLYADDFIIRNDLREKDELYLEGLTLEERKNEIKGRMDQKENDEYEDWIASMKENEENEENEKNKNWESPNSSFYDATDGQLGKLGEEGWTSIGRD
jgi:hypothetical protein